MNPRVSIVIPTFNGQELLARYLASVLEAADSVAAEVIVVDDGSTDGTVDFLRQRFPSVMTLPIRKNTGFSRAVDYGVEHAKGEVVVCLNNDVEATSGFLPPLLRHFRDPSVFAVIPRMLSSTDSRVNESVNFGKLKRGLFVTWRVNDPNVEARLIARAGGAFPVLYASGGAGAYSREKFLALGGFDSWYTPCYGEDVDLSYRAWKRGWKVLYEPDSVVSHRQAATTMAVYGTSAIRLYRWKNHLLCNWRNLTDRGALVQHFVLLLPRMVAALLKGQGTFVTAVFLALPHLPEALRKRAVERREARRTDREVLAIFEPFLSELR